MNTTDEINNILALLENTIREYEIPDYLEITESDGCIYMLISKQEYKNVPLHERIQKVSALLEFDHDDVLDKFPVVIECLDSDELQSLFEIYGKQ